MTITLHVRDYGPFRDYGPLVDIHPKSGKELLRYETNTSVALSHDTERWIEQNIRGEVRQEKRFFEVVLHFSNPNDEVIFKLFQM